MRSLVFNRTVLLRLAILISALFLTIDGCSFYRDLTGYFNTYYNSKRLFDESVKEVLQSPQKDRDTNYFAPYNISPSTDKKFDSVITKCSKLIQYYSTTKWIPAAILMIGQSYEYKGEEESAIRKFRELLDNFPESDKRFDARLWMAKAQYHQKNQDEALNILKELFPDLRAEGRNDQLLESLMLQAQIYVDRKEYDQAAQTYALAVEVQGDDAMRSFAQFQYAQVLEQLGDKEKAADAYMRVMKFGPTFDLEFRSRLRAGVMFTSSSHQDKALTVLNQLNDEPLKPEQHGLVNLEIATAYLTAGDTATAFPIYDLIDTAYKHTEASTQSMYRRARYYEKVAHDFKRARMFYTKAKLENSAPVIAPQVERKTTDFNRYALLNDAVYRFNSAIHKDSSDTVLALTDTVTIPPSTETASLESELMAADRRLTPGFRPPEGVNPGYPSPSVFPAGGGSEEYQRRHMDRDLVNDDDDTLAPAEASLSPNDTSHSARADSLRRLGKQRSSGQMLSVTVDSVHSLLAQSYYELGALFYLELNDPDSAKYWYLKILDDYPTSRYVPRTYYALAEVYRTTADSGKADSLDKIILARYPATEYGRKLKSLTGGVNISDTTIAPVAMKYTTAESTLIAGRTDEALRKFKEIASLQPRDALSSKAAYAVGWIYENTLGNNDSAAVWYKKILKTDSTSIYASIVRPKLAVKENPETLKDLMKPKEEIPSARPDKTAIPPKIPPNQSVIQNQKAGQEQEEDVQDEDTDTTDEDADTTAEDTTDDNAP